MTRAVWCAFTFSFWKALFGIILDYSIDIWQKVKVKFKKPDTVVPFESTDETLYLIATIFNPAGYKSRYKLYYDFVGRMKKFEGVRLITVELVYGDSPFAVTKVDNPDHIQLRTENPMWHKENLINAAIARLPSTWKYISWIDADVHFSNPNWVANTIAALKKYQVAQMFSYALDLDAKGNGIVQHKGYGLSRTEDRIPPLARIHVGDRHHPGYAWAATREFIDAVGGVFDLGILGSGDWHMACAMTNRASSSFKPNGISLFSSGTSWLSADYKDQLRAWQTRANSILGGKIGYVDQILYHHWHGSKKDRGYSERWKILREFDFSPSKDLVRNNEGVLQFTGAKPELEQAVLAYFYRRFEDGKPTT